jgi:hypothetical protein
MINQFLIIALSAATVLLLPAVTAAPALGQTNPTPTPCDFTKVPELGCTTKAFITRAFLGESPVFSATLSNQSNNTVILVTPKQGTTPLPDYTTCTLRVTSIIPRDQTIDPTIYVVESLRCLGGTPTR